MDNSKWLTRLLIKQEKRHFVFPSLIKFVIYNRTILKLASLLWAIILLLVLLESLAALDVIDRCLAPSIVFQELSVCAHQWF